MKRTATLFSAIVVLLLAGLVSKSDRAQGQDSDSSPIIIRQIGLLNQTTGRESTPLFTPTSRSLYRVSAYANVTPASNAGTVCGTLTWTDEAGPQSSAIFCALSGNGIREVTVIIHGLPGQPVNLTVSLTGLPFTGEYNLFMTVEKL